MYNEFRTVGLDDRSRLFLAEHVHQVRPNLAGVVQKYKGVYACIHAMNMCLFLIVCIINRPWTSGVLMPSPHFSRSSKTTTGIRIWKRDWLFPIEGLFQFYFKVRVDYRRLSKENKNLGHYNYFRFGWRLEMDITFEDAQFYAVLVVSIVSLKNG